MNRTTSNRIELNRIESNRTYKWGYDDAGQSPSWGESLVSQEYFGKNMPPYVSPSQFILLYELPKGTSFRGTGS